MNKEKNVARAANLRMDNLVKFNESLFKEIRQLSDRVKALEESNEAIKRKLRKKPL